MTRGNPYSSLGERGERGRERGREGGREGEEKEGERERGKKEGREGGREGGRHSRTAAYATQNSTHTLTMYGSFALCLLKVFEDSQSNLECAEHGPDKEKLTTTTRQVSVDHFSNQLTLPPLPWLSEWCEQLFCPTKVTWLSRLSEHCVAMDTNGSYGNRQVCW